jgi:hypothetical protein
LIPYQFFNTDGRIPATRSFFRYSLQQRFVKRGAMYIFNVDTTIWLIKPGISKLVIVGRIRHANNGEKEPESAGRNE